MTGQSKLEEMPHKSDSNYHKGEPQRTCVSVHTHCTLQPNKHFTCFMTLRLYVEIHFYTADRPGPVPGHCPWCVVARIQHSPCRSRPQARAGTKALLQASAG